MNRREFCASSIATAISVAAAGSARVAAAQASAVMPESPTPRISLYKFIYDRRYSAARAFGVAAEHADTMVGTEAIHGDVTALWSRDLRREWSAGGGAIAGMTTARTLFCLEQLAKDHWMRVVIRAHHTLSQGNEIVHQLTAPEEMVTRMTSALAAADWPAQLPASLATCRGRNDAPRMTTAFTSTGDRRWAMTHPALVSFVIA